MWKGGGAVDDLGIGPQKEIKIKAGILDKIKKYLDREDSKDMHLSTSAVQIITACLLGVMLAGGSIYYYNYRNTGYAVKYNGKILGYVRDKGIAISALAVVKDEISKYDSSITVSDELEFEKLLVNSDKIINKDYIEETIGSGLYVKYTSYAVSINGTEVGLLKNQEEANKVIDGLRKYYEDEEKKNGAEILNITIKDNIKTEKKIVDSSKLTDADKVINTLISGKGTTIKYPVKPGDSIWKIARDNNMTIEEIAAVNPGLNVDMLQVGQNVNLSVSEPYLNVETTVKLAVDEKIPYNTDYVSDTSLYRGQSQVVESGEYGINRVVRQITKLNSKEITNSIVTADVVKEPVTRVLARGTKELVGTGKFSWPSGGYISSAFGSRSGGYHNGLDIAAPMGSPIYAADSGTVILAERYSGYGKLVIIDHGNGYTSYYGHCSSFSVSEGDTVTRGQKIANVGMTGDTTGPHVHFEIRLNGAAQNPLGYLK